MSGWSPPVMAWPDRPARSERFLPPRPSPHLARRPGGAIRRKYPYSSKPGLWASSDRRPAAQAVDQRSAESNAGADDEAVTVAYVEDHERKAHRVVISARVNSNYAPVCGRTAFTGRSASGAKRKPTARRRRFRQALTALSSGRLIRTAMTRDVKRQLELRFARA